MTKQLLLGLAIVAAVLTVTLTKTPTVNVTSAPAKVEVKSPEQLIGGSQSQDHYNPEFFRNGLYSNKYFGLDSVNASTTSSTAPTLQLGKGANGIITVGTSTPAIRIQNASTTAVTSNSVVLVKQVATGPAGVTCNKTQATNTMVSWFASSTNQSLSGFTITLGSIPTTDPACFFYEVFDRSKSDY